MENEKLQSTIEVVDGGTSTLDTLGYSLDYNRVIVVEGTIAEGAKFLVEKVDISTYKRRKKYAYSR